MKFLKNSLIFTCLTVIFLSSCKNDVELNAPYKEYPSIYAVLNPNEHLQMIRINKVFLGVGDANQMAKVADSINYGPGEITVSLKHSSGKSPVTFHDSLVNTESGAFNTNQRIYVSNDKLFNTGTYTLTVKNNHTGNVFNATANPIKAIDSTGSPFDYPYYPYPPGSTVGYIDYKTYNGSVYFKPVDGAKIYQVVIRSHFYTSSGGNNTYDYVDYIFHDPHDIRSLSGIPYISITFKSADYFSAIGQLLAQKKLDVSSSVQGRKMWLMEYFVYASTQEYVDYMEYVKPSLSINQNKPLYSNFKDQAALGIFTFRSTCVVQKELSTSFVTAFADDSHTCYKFLRSDNSVGCFNR